MAVWRDLVWGTANMAAKLALERRTARRLSAPSGAVGLTTARLLEDRDFPSPSMQANCRRIPPPTLPPALSASPRSSVLTMRPMRLAAAWARLSLPHRYSSARRALRRATNGLYSLALAIEAPGTPSRRSCSVRDPRTGPTSFLGPCQPVHNVDGGDEYLNAGAAGRFRAHGGTVETRSFADNPSLRIRRAAPRQLHRNWREGAIRRSGTHAAQRPDHAHQATAAVTYAYLDPVLDLDTFPRSDGWCSAAAMNSTLVDRCRSAPSGAILEGHSLISGGMR